MRGPFLALKTGHSIVARPLHAPPVVIDGGTNKGEFSRELLQHWPDARIYAIEPTPALHTHLEGLPLAHLYKAALSDQRGSATFHLNENCEASGLESISQGELATINVATLPLNEIIDETQSTHIDLLKLDIEGAEIQVLQSLPDSYLARIDQITVEYHEINFPEHLPKIAQINRRLKTAGFRRICFHWPQHDNVLYYRPDRFTLPFAAAAIAQARRIYWYEFRRRFSS